MGLGLRPSGVFVVSGGRGMVLDNLDHPIADQPLQRCVIDVGVGDVTLLVGTQVEHLAPRERNTNRCVGLVANGLHGVSS